MPLLDEVNQLDPNVMDDPTLIPGLQKPAGVMHKPGVMSEYGVGAAPRPGKDYFTDPGAERAFRQQIDLQRIGQIAKQLEGVDPEARTQILARILGIPLKSRQQQMAEQQMARALMSIQEQKRRNDLFERKFESDQGFRDFVMKQKLVDQQKAIARQIVDLSKEYKEYINKRDPRAMELSKQLLDMQRQYSAINKQIEKDLEARAKAEESGVSGGGGGGSRQQPPPAAMRPGEAY